MSNETQPAPALLAQATLTTREVAQQLGLAVRSVQLMVDRGDLDAWKTAGGHRRISRESVVRWLARTSNKGTMAPQVAEPTAHRTATDNPAAQPDAPARRRATDSRQPSVVLIEDSAHVQNMIRLLLKHSHPEVHLQVAGDAVLGLAMCGATRPDVLIIDILLPGIDGATLVNSLRSQRLFQGMQLLVVTALDESERAPYAYALGKVPVIEKHNLTRELPPTLTALLAASRVNRN